MAPNDAGVAGGLVNVAHHLGGALGLGILVTIFDAAGAGTHGRTLLADRVSTALTVACGFLVLAVVATIAGLPRKPVVHSTSAEDRSAVAATAIPAHPAHPAAEALSDNKACA